MRKKLLSSAKCVALVVLLFILVPEPALAYIGPGAGFALLSSLFALLVSFFLAFISLLTLPFRFLVFILKQRKRYAQSLIKRVVVLGYDGLDPSLCEEYIKAGKLPNFSKLIETGCFKRLGTTTPPLSPVAWSTFATGVNPARHRIFDFLERNPKTYLPELSSSRIGHARKSIKIGKYSIPIAKPPLLFLRKSKSFWTILGEHGIFSHILRVPITFPPEKFNGALLSGMCAPDIRGTQGTFSYYSSRPENETPDSEYTGGTRLPLTRNGRFLSGELLGPEHILQPGFGPMRLPFRIEIDEEKEEARLRIHGSTYDLKKKTFTPWIRVHFKAGFGIKVRGICQFYLKRMSPDVELYVSPIHIDPERPALPISHPYFYSVYLAKLLGNYGTLGLMEDTWALNEHVLDEKAFLEQVYQMHEEREKQFFHALGQTKRGVCACVFDATDRIQHMFFRFLTDSQDSDEDASSRDYKAAIEEVYRRADDLLGRVMDRIRDDTVLLVMSDHGFKSFNRGINLNTWLHQNGYLTLKVDDGDGMYLSNVDWQKTRAYALGLAGMYLNQRGREKLGIVEPDGEATKLKDEIRKKLSGLRDPASKTVAIREVYDSHHVYSGPYVNEAPDLIVGYNEGFRVSWDSAVGKTTEDVFEENEKCWSGDHGIDPKLVPGVLFSNHPIDASDPNIKDIAPTILKLFGVPVPPYMEGKPWKLPELEDKNIKDE